MRDGYLSTQFAADLDRLGFAATRKISPKQLDALEAALRDLAEGETPVFLDADTRQYVRLMHERAAGSPPRAPDFEEIVHGSTWLADPANPDEAAEAFDTSGDVPPAGLLCLGEWKSGELWILDVAVKHGYVFLVDERREIHPMFRSIGEFAQWAVANELWKRRIAKDGEVPERLERLHWFKTLAVLRDNGLVPPTFKPKRFKPAFQRPTHLSRAEST